MTEITFTDAAIDDLRKIGPDAVPKVLKKVLLLLDSPTAGYPLGGVKSGRSEPGRMPRSTRKRQRA